uniref:Glycosyltransferase 2-like domain-containing protein n=1 Tax=Bubo bubo TaxID=30461 RepID=A0A8C0IFF1_BUBBB
GRKFITAGIRRRVPCSEQWVHDDLPTTTIIMCFVDEVWSTLLRSVHSVLSRSPPHLIQEVILVDDFSTKEYLKEKLDKYMSRFPKVKILHLKERHGLIRARLAGAQIAKGGLFSINKKYFFELGTYDPGLDVWGGENMEISFKVWMCGGEIEIVPCSRVGHIFRNDNPYSFPKDRVRTVERNLARVAEVWLDEYKELFYGHAYHLVLKNLDVGDLTQQIQLRKKLRCKSFRWYLENVYPDLEAPLVKASGLVRTRHLVSSRCTVSELLSLAFGNISADLTCHSGLDPPNKTWVLNLAQQNIICCFERSETKYSAEKSYNIDCMLVMIAIAKIKHLVCQKNYSNARNENERVCCLPHPSPSPSATAGVALAERRWPGAVDRRAGMAGGGENETCPSPGSLPRRTASSHCASPPGSQQKAQRPLGRVSSLSGGQGHNVQVARHRDPSGSSQALCLPQPVRYFSD